MVQPIPLSETTRSWYLTGPVEYNVLPNVVSEPASLIVVLEYRWLAGEPWMGPVHSVPVPHLIAS
jgi:hypothetical protein